MTWKPHVTVAAIVERDGQLLIVEEETESGIRYNQPAGHLEPGESLIDACVRETLEETAHHFIPRYLVGIYHWHNVAKDATYLRFAFGGELTGHEAGRALDAGIIAAHWWPLDQIRAVQERHRSPLLLQGIEDWQAGARHPLSLLTHYA